jgi:hypothetical protein
MADPTAPASQDRGHRPGTTSLFTRKVLGGLLVKEGDGRSRYSIIDSSRASLHIRYEQSSSGAFAPSITVRNRPGAGRSACAPGLEMPTCEGAPTPSTPVAETGAPPVSGVKGHSPCKRQVVGFLCRSVQGRSQGVVTTLQSCTPSSADFWICFYADHPYNGCIHSQFRIYDHANTHIS